METQFLKKYKPLRFNEFIIDNKYIQLLKLLIAADNLNILFIGDNSSGKSSLLNATILEYYNTNKLPLDNILIINNLREQGIQYYRNEVKTFCQTPSIIKNKKKIIILDDIDLINKQSQQVFRNCIDNYSHNVNFLASCNNIQKVIDNLQSRCEIIKINNLTNNQLYIILNKICINEQININEKYKHQLIKLCNGNIRLIINFLEKIKLLNYDNEYNDEDDILKICTNISYNEFDKYTNLWFKDKNIKLSIKILHVIYDKGYSVIDILDAYYNYIKHTNIINEDIKYKVIKIICEYISYFYTVHENKIELTFFTNKLIQKIK